MGRCSKGGDPVVRYGDWREVYDLGGKLVYASRITQDMCSDMFNRYLAFKANINPDEISKIKTRRAK